MPSEDIFPLCHTFSCVATDMERGVPGEIPCPSDRNFTHCGPSPLSLPITETSVVVAVCLRKDSDTDRKKSKVCASGAHKAVR